MEGNQLRYGDKVMVLRDIAGANSVQWFCVTILLLEWCCYGWRDEADVVECCSRRRGAMVIVECCGGIELIKVKEKDIKQKTKNERKRKEKIKEERRQKQKRAKE